jgi:protein-tyrosine phosphatase
VIVELPSGVVIQATAFARDGHDPDPEFGLYLDHRWKTKDLAWESEVLDWPDFGLPSDTEAAGRAIRDAYERARLGGRVEVGCLGGIGRTGTVLGCMAVLAGVPAGDARRWVRTHYHPLAIETEDQHRFVLEFARSPA